MRLGLEFAGAEEQLVRHTWCLIVQEIRQARPLLLRDEDKLQACPMLPTPAETDGGV